MAWATAALIGSACETQMTTPPLCFLRRSSRVDTIRVCISVKLSPLGNRNVLGARCTFDHSGSFISLASSSPVQSPKSHSSKPLLIITFCFKALAIGADDAIRVNAAPRDAYFTAFQIAEYAKANDFDMILCGRESIDYNGSQVAAMVGEFLEIPSISIIKKLDFDGTTATIEREIEGGKEVVEVDGPFIASCAEGVAEWKIPNMRGIMAARTKPLNVIAPVATDELTTYVEYGLPSAKSAVKMIDPSNMDELVALLHNEAKVI